MAYSGPYPLPLQAGGTAKNKVIAFYAYLSTAVTDVTGDGTIYTILFDTVAFDSNSAYSTGTGEYTAPVTGIYKFGFSIETNSIGAGHTGGFAEISCAELPSDGVSYVNIINPAAAAYTGGLLSFSGSTLISLTATTTVAINLVINNSTKTVGISGAAGGNPTNSYFYGYLVV